MPKAGSGRNGRKPPLAHHHRRAHNPRMEPLLELLGRASSIEKLREQIRQVLGRMSHAGRLPPILLDGETGTGKNLVAHILHRGGPRRDGPFVDVNCAAIPEGLLEAELFGFERGAFTDARQPKAGLFQCANSGTIFLDEITLLPDSLQAKLLKVIEDRTVRRLGRTSSEPVDVSIIAATNENLEAAVRARRFRQDLYHRLAALTLRLPPLRERPHDIPALADHFLEHACRDYGLSPKTLTPAALAALRAHGWPGNVRELANTMERVALMSETPRIRAELLALPIQDLPAEAVPAPLEASLEARVETWEHQELLRALHHTRGNVVRAAVRLGITRGTIRYRLAKYGLEPAGRGGRRRPGPTAAGHSPRSVAPSTPTAPWWEGRVVALLEATVRRPDAANSPLDFGRDFDTVVQKVESFGGRIEEAGASRIVASFGADPMEDGPRRAALAAMAIRNALTTDPTSVGRGVPVVIALHADKCPVRQVSGRAEIDGDVKRRMTELVDDLCTCGKPDAVLISDVARSLLGCRFDVDDRGERGEVVGVGHLLGYYPDRFGLGAQPG